MKLGWWRASQNDPPVFATCSVWVIQEWPCPAFYVDAEILKKIIMLGQQDLAAVAPSPYPDPNLVPI